MGIAKVTRNYQVTIPQDVRTIQGIEIGDTVLFALEGSKVDFLKIEREDLIKSVAGIWTSKETGFEYTKRIRKDWEKRRKRLSL